MKVGWKTTRQLSVVMALSEEIDYLNSKVFCEYLAKEELTPRARYRFSRAGVLLHDAPPLPQLLIV